LTPTLQIERERPPETRATNRDELLGSGIVREIERELSL
jgi:hypothetical protein